MASQLTDHEELLADTLFGVARHLPLLVRASMIKDLSEWPPSSLRAHSCWHDFNKEAILDSAPENPVYSECITLSILALAGKLVG